MVTMLFKTVGVGIGYTGKIEETVIGQVDDGGFVGSSPVFDDQSIGLHPPGDKSFLLPDFRGSPLRRQRMYS